MLIGARCNVNEATVVSTAQVLGGLDWPQASSLKAMVCILQDKYTPLHWAAMHGHAAVCHVLVTAGSEVNAANSVSTASTSPVCVLFSWLVLTTGRTLPCCVCSCPCCNALCVRLQDMCTALHLAAQRGHASVFTALFQRGAKVDATNKVLQDCMQHGWPRFALDSQIVRARCVFGAGHVHGTALGCSTRPQRCVQSAGDDRRCQVGCDQQGECTPCAQCHRPVQLTALGVAVLSQAGRSPLHLAVENGHAAVCTVLCDLALGEPGVDGGVFALDAAISVRHGGVRLQCFHQHTSVK